MAMQRIGVLGLAVAFLMSLGAPRANAEDRRERDRFKQDVLKAVERLMEKKLKDFRNDLMKDMREMLRGREGRKGQEKAVRVQRAKVSKAVEGRKRRVAVLRAHPDKKGPRIHIEGPMKRKSKHVSVVTQGDGKVHLRIEADGKVIEKEFDLKDPNLKRWLKQALPEGFEFELPGKGKGMLKVQVHGKRHPQRGRMKEGPDSRGRGNRQWIEAFKKWTDRKGVPGFDRFEDLARRWKGRFGDRRQSRGEGKPRVFELKKDFILPFVEEFKGFHPKKAKEALRFLKPRVDVEIEELERQKDNLKKELDEIKGLLKKLIERMKRKR